MAKSILEEALLQVTQLEEAVKKNAKEILANTMKQEIDELVKESMEETKEIETEETTDEVAIEEQFEESDDTDTDEEDIELEDNEESEDSEEDVLDLDVDLDDVSLDMDDIEMPSLELPSLGDEEENEVIDMTGASDEEILKVFKAMGDEDGIIVSQDDEGTVHLEDGDDEYRIEMNESDETEEDEEEVTDEVMETEELEENPIVGAIVGGAASYAGGKIASSIMDEETEEEVVYEIELDDEIVETEEVEIEESDETIEGDMEEASRTHAADAKVPSNQGKKYKAGRKDLSEEVETLTVKNGELTEALKLFRNKLNEVGVFNANLAYATRLFTEHTTTKSEKLNILKRFDSIETLKESKSLYNSIKNELTGSDTKLTETVVNKISSSPKSGSSEKLVESKTYENPQIKRIKEMMGITK